MKIRTIFSLSVFLFCVCNVWAQTNIPGVFSTGVDNSGNVLAPGQTDPHYTISASPIGAVPALTSTLSPTWVTNTPSSAWINATGNGTDIEPAGFYAYVLLFSMNGLDPSTAQITGLWASDNASEIYFNGVDTGISNYPDEFSALDPFSITNGFVAGQNQLLFYVTQDPTVSSENPEGLQVDIISATAQPVPEPAAVSLLGLSGLLLAGRFLKNKRSTGCGASNLSGPEQPASLVAPEPDEGGRPLG